MNKDQICENCTFFSDDPVIFNKDKPYSTTYEGSCRFISPGELHPDHEGVVITTKKSWCGRFKKKGIQE